MDVIEMFQVLGIGATKDEQAIKNAYREKLAVTNPEDNPEGFKRLRTAYEEACVYAKTEDEETGAPEKQDDTPSGQWAQRAADIYKNIAARRDLNKWQELFEDDLFLSLEEEENCRFKLLSFLMDHYKLPTDVWKLLDKKLNIVADAQGLRERFPADYIHYIVSRCERGEDLDFSQFEGEAEAPYDLYLQYYDRCWNALQERNLEQAEEFIKNAEELSIFHPVLEVCKAHLLVEREKTEEAIGIMRSLLERYPKDSMVSYNTAEILWHHGGREEAAVVYQKIKEENDAHYMANFRLTEWYYDQGEYHKSKDCAEKVLSAGADDSFMELLAKVNQEIEKEMETDYRRNQDVNIGLELCWCYLQDGKVSKGIKLAESLSADLPEEKDAEYKGLLAKLYIEETEYDEAIVLAEKWEEALQKKLESDEDEGEKEKDRDRLRQSHAIRMQSLRAIGDVKTSAPETRRNAYEKAIAEGEAALLQGSAQDIGLFMEMAQIYMEMEEFEKGLDLTKRLIEEYQVYAAYATELEIHRRQWNAGGVVQAGRSCIQFFPNYARAYEHVAKVFLDLGRREDLEALLEEAKKNNAESVILDAYRYQMMRKPPETEVLDQKLKEFRNTYFDKVEYQHDENAYMEGLPILTEYLYWYPGTYMLVERGLFHRIARHYEEAKADFEKALQENPCQPYALNALSFVYKYQGDYEKALIYIKRAIRYREQDMSSIIYADMANLYSLLGNYDQALKSYRIYAIKNSKLSSYHLERLALCMARAGKVEEAIQKYRSELRDSHLERFDHLVDLYQITGDGEKAAEQLKEWEEKLFALQSGVSAWDHEKFYIRMAWQDVLYGDGSRSVEYYDKIIALAQDESNEMDVSLGTLGDAIFLCILCGKDKRGRELGDQLMARVKKGYASAYNEDGSARFYRSKAHLREAVLAAYYREPEERIERFLGEDERTEICHHCHYCVCKELESVHIVFLLRQGKREEALARMEQNLERQPLDEYMLAIKNMCVKNGVVIKAPEPVLEEPKNTPAMSESKNSKYVGQVIAKKKSGLLDKLKGLLG